MPLPLSRSFDSAVSLLRILIRRESPTLVSQRPTWRRIVALLSATLVTAQAGELPSTGAFVGVPGSARYNVIADLDGNGQDEIVIASERQTPTFPIETGTTFALAGRITADDWGIRTVFHVSVQLHDA